MRWLKTSSPFLPFSMLPMVIGPVCWHEIAALDGSSNQLPLLSRSIRLRSKLAIWQVTPCTFGSAIASTTIPLPIQSFVKLPTSSARAAPARQPAARQAIATTLCIHRLPETARPVCARQG